MPSYDCGHVPAVAVGPGSIERLEAANRVFAATSAVIVVDESVVSSGYVARVGAVLDRLDVRVEVVPSGEPTVQSVDAVAEAVRRASSPIVIGIGGGTTLDTAKLASVVAEGCHGAEHYALGAHALPGRRPIIAIPTTAGTGSEVTRTCVITDRHGRKVWTWGDELVPDLVLLDPTATVTMPPHVTAATGLDAFVHALEAATGRRATTLVTAPALHAILLVLDHLPAAVARGDDLEVRQAMQEAALLAGVAIDCGGTGIAHAIGHALGTLAHVPHGVAVAVGLGAALEWNVDGAPEAFESVARSIGRPVRHVPEVYAELLRASRFPRAVQRLGGLEMSVDDLAATVVAEENLPMYTNSCRIASERERAFLAESTLALWDELRSEA